MCSDDALGRTSPRVLPSRCRLGFPNRHCQEPGPLSTHHSDFAPSHQIEILRITQFSSRSSAGARATVRQFPDPSQRQPRPPNAPSRGRHTDPTPPPRYRIRIHPPTTARRPRPSMYLDPTTHRGRRTAIEPPPRHRGSTCTPTPTTTTTATRATQRPPKQRRQRARGETAR